MRRLGFVINPIAGMGGRVGLKGTDDVVNMAVELGASPSAYLKAEQMLTALYQQLGSAPASAKPYWLTCSGRMGADSLHNSGFSDYEIVYDPGARTRSEDTKAAVTHCLEHGAELILFCGGDGTARDIVSVVHQTIPILGIPAGVKMYSGVFGISPARTADILIGFLTARLSPGRADIIDLDEERYRQGEWRVRLYDTAYTLLEPSLTQTAKVLIEAQSDSNIKAEIAEHLCEQMTHEPDTLFLLGPGSTVATVSEQLGIAKTLLGVDALAASRLIAKDLNETQIMSLLKNYRHHRLILSPLGAQGFVLGRGNQQLSPAVIKTLGCDNLIIVATPAKLARTPVLRFDTGDADLDLALAKRGFIAVINGYHRRRLVKVMI